MIECPHPYGSDHVSLVTARHEPVRPAAGVPEQPKVNPLVVPARWSFFRKSATRTCEALIADAANASPQTIMVHGGGMAPNGSAAQGWYCAVA
jgi:hypothetical protein